MCRYIPGTPCECSGAGGVADEEEAGLPAPGPAPDFASFLGAAAAEGFVGEAGFAGGFAVWAAAGAAGFGAAGFSSSAMGLRPTSEGYLNVGSRSRQSGNRARSFAARRRARARARRLYSALSS